MPTSPNVAAPWGRLLGDRVSTRAFTVAKEVAERLRNRDLLLAANEAARSQTRFPKTVYWEPYGVAQGDAGLALACAYFDQCFPSEGWDRRGHDYLNLATRAAASVKALPSGLFAGLSGLEFAARALSRDGRRCGTLLETLGLRLCADAVAR